MFGGYVRYLLTILQALTEDPTTKDSPKKSGSSQAEGSTEVAVEGIKPTRESSSDGEVQISSEATPSPLPATPEDAPVDHKQKAEPAIRVLSSGRIQINTKDLYSVPLPIKMRSAQKEEFNTLINSPKHEIVKYASTFKAFTISMLADVMHSSKATDPAQLEREEINLKAVCFVLCVDFYAFFLQKSPSMLRSLREQMFSRCAIISLGR